MLRGFIHHDFERRPDMSPHEVTAMRRAVRFPNHHVRVDAGDPLIKGNRAGEGENLDLLRNRNNFVIFPIRLKEAE